MENKHSKYYICLDRDDYTMYLDEKEILLQAGLKGELINVAESDDRKLTVFTLHISDKVVEKEFRKRNLDYSIPIIIYSLEQIYITAFTLLYHRKMAIIDVFPVDDPDPSADNIN